MGQDRLADLPGTIRKQLPADQLHWHRIQQDGLPFYGSPPVVASDEEWEEKTQYFGVAHVAVFNLQDASHRQYYEQILEMCSRHLWTILYIERMITPQQQLIHLEWMEWAVEAKETGANGHGPPSRR